MSIEPNIAVYCLAVALLQSVPGLNLNPETAILTFYCHGPNSLQANAFFDVFVMAFLITLPFNAM